jgi:hypothetical protein
MTYAALTPNLLVLLSKLAFRVTTLNASTVLFMVSINRPFSRHLG